MSGKIHEYKGKEITVRYDARRCIHAGECVRGLPSVFDPDRRPWVDPAGAAPEVVAEVVMRCPTGALRFERSGGAGEPVPEAASITVAPDGPLYLRGDIEVLGPDGSVILRDTRAALCRCGASREKPLCDGSHSKAGFRDVGALPAAAARPRGGPACGSKLRAALVENGPILFDGSIEVASAGGAETCRLDGPALCRCGASREKPFCDGSHKRVGFPAL